MGTAIKVGRLPLVLLLVFFYSCSAPKTVRTSKKIIKGEWLLSNVSYSADAKYTISLLNDASSACFENSNWKFIPNNNTGTYSINKSECLTGERYFIFTIQEVDAATGYYDFLLKPTDSKGKSADNRGFRLHLNYLDDNKMTWSQKINTNGDEVTILMDFTKVL